MFVYRGQSSRLRDGDWVINSRSTNGVMTWTIVDNGYSTSGISTTTRALAAFGYAARSPGPDRRFYIIHVPDDVHSSSLTGSGNGTFTEDTGSIERAGLFGWGGERYPERKIEHRSMIGRPGTTVSSTASMIRQQEVLLNKIQPKRIFGFIPVVPHGTHGDWLLDVGNFSRNSSFEDSSMGVINTIITNLNRELNLDIGQPIIANMEQMFII